MPEYSLPVGNKDLINIARRAFNLVDPRLIGHGARVSYLVFQMLKEDGTYTPSEMRNLLILAALHDIGAYKTEEIDRNSRRRKCGIIPFTDICSFTILRRLNIGIPLSCITICPGTG